jgi:hypothetical protein
MPVLMLMLITLLNDGTLISIGYDNVNPSKTPDKCVSSSDATISRSQLLSLGYGWIYRWGTFAARETNPLTRQPTNPTNQTNNRWNLKVLFTVASVLAGVACISSLLMLYVALDSTSPTGFWQKCNLPPITYGQITSMVYLKVSVSDFLTLFRCVNQQTKEGSKEGREKKNVEPADRLDSIRSLSTSTPPPHTHTHTRSHTARARARASSGRTSPPRSSSSPLAARC